MFRGPYRDESSDEEAPTVSEEPTTVKDVIEGASTSGPTDQTANASSPAARNDPPSQPAARTTRPSLFLANLPSQTITPAEIAEAQAATEAAQTGTYEPSRAAHTIRPIYPVDPNGFQSSNSLTPTARAPSTPIRRVPIFPNTRQPTGPDPQMIASFPLLLSPPLVTDADEIETLLAPVKTELQRLRGTKMPPDNGRVASKSAMQVLKDRVLPVGRYVLQRVAGIDEGRRAAVEVDVW